MIRVTATALAIMVAGIAHVRAQDLTAWYNNQVAQQNAMFNRM